VIVVGDVKRPTFSIPQLFDLEAFVAAQGGGLIFLGGQHTLGPGQHYARSPIAKLLPFTYADTFERREEDVTLRLTSEGRRHAVMRLHHDAEQNAAHWHGLAPMWGHWTVGPVKPAALVLATAKSADEKGPGLPVIVAQRYGKGRSVVFAGDSCWRWSLCAAAPEQPDVPAEDEPNHHYRFWANVVRWVSGEISDPDELTFVTTDRSAYEVGDTVHLLARVLDENHRPSARAAVTATVSRESEEVAALQLRPEPGTRGFYRGVFRPEREGDHTIAVRSVLPREGQEELAGKAETAATVESPNREFRSVAVNEELLRSLAAASGGKLLTTEDAADLCAELRESTPAVRQAFEVDPLDAPLTWLLFVGLLFGEWIFRKSRGMA